MTPRDPIIECWRRLAADLGYAAIVFGGLSVFLLFLWAISGG